MRKVFRKLHLWLSVPFGIVVAVICFTGALLVFEDEITSLYYSGVSTVEPQREVLPLGVIVEKVEQGLSSGTEVTGVVVSSSPCEAYKVNLSKPRRAALYVNQYTGEVQGDYRRLGFFSGVLRLHRWLMDTKPDDGGIYWGKIAVGASALVFVVLLLTGLVLWLPRNRKMFKNRLKVVFSKGKNRLWYDLHVTGGFYAALLLLVMALTGLTWSFGWYSDSFYSLFLSSESDVSIVTQLPDATTGATTVSHNRAAQATLVSENDAVSAATFLAAQSDGSTGATVKADGVSGATTANNGADGSTGATVKADGVSGATAVANCSAAGKYGSWSKALEAVAALCPDFAEITVSAGSVSVKYDGWGNSRASDKYNFDESVGTLLSVQEYAGTTEKSRVRGWVYSLHTGSWGGVVVKFLYFLAALLGTALPLTGYYFWIKRLYGKRKQK